MNKVNLHAAALLFIYPFSIFAMGLGDLKVSSSLNQPFNAEIVLLDIGNTLPTAIQVHAASNEEYERIGFVRSFGISLLEFNLAKNAKGQPIIKITSKDRMTEPYLDLLMDLAWPTGQIYKEYVVLLDPPGYALQTAGRNRIKASYTSYTSHQAQANNNSGTQPVITQAIYASETASLQQKQLTYGPIAPGETIWQIAQHYKIPELQLSQLVLAIVGMNPDAFTEGNLNGLKTGAHLIIPSANKVILVPVDLAPQEVVAHDEAWKEKQPIKHIIWPPYIPAELPSQIESVHNNAESLSRTERKITSEIPKTPTFGAIVDDNTHWVPSEKSYPSLSENAATTAVLQAAQASNVLLNNQLIELRKQNKLLQERLDKRENDWIEIQNQLKIIIKDRQAVAAQAYSVQPNANHSSFTWLLWFIGIAAISGVGFAFWRSKKPLPAFYQDIVTKLRTRFKQSNTDQTTSPLTSEQPEKMVFGNNVVETTKKTVEKPIISAPVVETKPPVVKESQPFVEETVLVPDASAAELAGNALHTHEEIISQESSEDPHTMEFEQGLYHLVEENDETTEGKGDNQLKNINHENTNLLKSKKALDTLIDLAHTYISMGDFEAATQSLKEVIIHGDEVQKKNAEELIQSISSK